MQKIKDFVKRILVEDNSAHSIAMGLAIGVFIGLLPIFGFQMIPVVAISIRFKINKLAAIAGVWVTNPFTFIPIYSFNYWVGQKVMAFRTEDIKTFKNFLTSTNFTWETLSNLGYSTLLPLVVGSLLNGAVFSLIVYLISKFFIIKWHIRNKKIK